MLAFSFIETHSQQFANYYGPKVPAGSGSSTYWQTRNVQTKGVCPIGNGEYAVVSTLEVQIDANNWQSAGQVMIVLEDGTIRDSRTYYTGLAAPLAHIKFNAVAYIPSEQLDIFRKTMDTTDEFIVPASGKQKVRIFTGTDNDYADTNNWHVRDRGVLLIAGARRPMYPYYKNGSISYDVCSNYQAAYYAVDVETLDTLTTASYACNEGLDASGSIWDISEYNNLRFEYQGYTDDNGSTKQTGMRQRVAFVGMGKIIGSLGSPPIVLAARCDLYYIATGTNYQTSGWPYPSFITRTFNSLLPITSFTAGSEGLDIDMRYRDQGGDSQYREDWQYVVCGYTQRHFEYDYTERAFSFIVNDTLNQVSDDKEICIKNNALVIDGDRSSRATAVTWAAPQNDPNPQVRWYGAYNNGYVVAGIRGADTSLDLEQRTFIARYPYQSNYTPYKYAEYGLGIPDTISSHPGFSIIARTAAVDSADEDSLETYNLYVSGWWNDLNEPYSAKTSRWLHVDDNLDPVAGYEYVRTQLQENHGYRMCNDNNSDGFVIVGDLNLGSVACDTSYKGGGLPYVVKIDNSGLIDPGSKICDADALPLRYTCSGVDVYDPQDPVSNCSPEKMFACTPFGGPTTRRFYGLETAPCEASLCTSEESKNGIMPEGNARKTERVLQETGDPAELTVVPNPASESFSVRFAGKAALTVRDMLGRTVFAQTINGKLLVPTAELLPGIYYVEAIRFDGGKATTNVLVTK